MGESSAERPCVSVIVCHHRGRTLIDRCLTSVRASQGVTVDLVVVTSDPTYTAPVGRLLFLDDGPAAKRNLGVAHSDAEYCVFLDDDVEVSPDCLAAFVRFLETHPTCGMAFAKILKMEEGRRDEFDDCGSWLTWTGFLWARAQNKQYDRGQFDVPTRILASKSATCIITREAFNRVRGFDQSYYILGEETDLAWRVWLSGAEVWYVPTAVSWHAFGCESLKPKQEFYTDERIFYRGCKNYLSLLWTNVGLGRLSRTLPPHVSAWVLSAAGFFFTGHPRRSVQIMRALWDTARTLPDLQRNRRRVQTTRVISDRVLWPLISYQPPFSYYWQRMTRYLTQGLHG